MQLCAQGFEYAHTSYIVNLRAVTKIMQNELTMRNGDRLGISRTCSKKFHQSFLLKFGATLFGHLVFYDFFRDQLKFRVRDRKLRFLILLLCAAALRLVNSFDSRLINLLFGLPVLLMPVLLILKDDHRKETFLLLIGGAVALFSELVIELFFVKMRELSFWAGYSLIYIGNEMIEALAHKAGAGMASVEYLPVAAGILSCFGVALVGTVRCALLFVSTRKIVGSYCSKQRGRMGKEVAFYLLPSVAGTLVSVLVRLLMITVTDGIPVLLYDKYPALYLIIPMTALVLLGAVVYGFRIYQDMAALQEERAEKIVLENQISQMQSSMVEMEHLYDGIRSVKHDMKNHMTVLQNLIQKRYSGEDEEIQQYFEGMRQSVEQIDSRVHTGNAVSDAVVGSKFRYAAKKVKGIRLDASKFMLTDAVTIKAYDMGIILNNGLDNAVEACMPMREKQPDAEAHITIRSFKAKNMYFIEIENSFDGSALSRGDSGLPISTKKDKEVHGIGLKNIRKCAVKYGGDLDCIVEGNKFTLSVMVKS